MPWYKVGTVSVVQNSNAVTGTGTAFIANSRVGDGFRGPDGRWYEVTNIASNTALSISPNYEGPTAAGGVYAIMPVQGYQKDLADQVRTILNDYGGVLAVLGTTPTTAGVRDELNLTDTDGLPEGGTNKYFTGSRVLQSVLAGLSTATSAVVAATDTVLAAIGKLQAQVTARAMKGANSDISSITGLTTALSIGQGGTGAITAPAAATALGLGTANAPQFTGLELSAVAPYVDFHFNSSSADYSIRMLCESAATLSLTHDFAPRSTYCRLGVNGARGSGRYNFNWTGSALDAYIDASYIGSVSLFTSDYRIKKYIKDFKVTSFLDRIDAYRIVTFQKKIFGEVFEGDGTTYQGLIAHEAQAVNPLAVSGEKDGVDEQGNPVIQQLDPIALITDLMGAMKELRAEINALKAVGNAESV